MLRQKNIFSFYIFLLGLIVGGYSDMPHMAQEAAIFPSKDHDGEHIAWSASPDWSDLENVLASSGLTVIADVCIQGMWLLYDKPDYEVLEKTEYRMVTGSYNCIEKPGKVLSMQPFGSESITDSSSITLFSEKFFGSKAFPLSRDTGRTTMDIFEGSVQSLIITGLDEWTVVIESTGGSTKSVCLQPVPVDTYVLPVCLLQNVEYTTLEKNMKVLFVQRGCAESEPIVTLSDCKPYEELPELSEPEPPQEVPLPNLPVPKKRTMKVGTAPDVLYCTGDGPSSELRTLLRLLKLRRENDFVGDAMIPWSNNNDNVWKSEIADMTFDIAIMVCPEISVSHDFLHLVREAFMFELHDLWTSSGAPEIDDREIELIISQLQKCSFRSKDGAQWGLRSMTAGEIVNDLPFMEGVNINPKLKFNESNNLAIDALWVAGNLVASVCHTTLQYKNNFWYNYINIFNRLYLEPLAQSASWKNGLSRQMYDFYLSGYGIDQQLSGFSLCATNALRVNPNMEPFKRPTFVD